MMCYRDLALKVWEHLLACYDYNESNLILENGDEPRILYKKTGKYVCVRDFCNIYWVSDEFDFAYKLNKEFKGYDDQSYTLPWVEEGYEAGRVVFKLVNKEKNRERVERQHIPCREFLDYYVLYAIQSEKKDDTTLNVEVTRPMMIDLGTSEEHLYEYAYEQTEKIAKFKTQNIMDIIYSVVPDGQLYNVMLDIALDTKCGGNVLKTKALLDNVEKSSNLRELFSNLKAAAGLNISTPIEEAFSNKWFSDTLKLLEINSADDVYLVLHEDDNRTEDVSLIRKVFTLYKQPGPKMYAITSDNFMYGATVLLYTDYLDHLADTLKCDELIVIPSSICEVLVLKNDTEFDERINNMVQEVNKTFPEDKVLGERAWVYKVSDKSFSPVQ